MATQQQWLVDFGQKVDLTARLREILLNYPEGTSILKELVQVSMLSKQHAVVCHCLCITTAHTLAATMTWCSMTCGRMEDCTVLMHVSFLNDRGDICPPVKLRSSMMCCMQPSCIGSAGVSY